MVKVFNMKLGVWLCDGIEISKCILILMNIDDLFLHKKYYMLTILKQKLNLRVINAKNIF